jgi:hypothetical protein
VASLTRPTGFQPVVDLKCSATQTMLVGRDSMEDYAQGHIPVERRHKLPTLAG